MTPLTATVPAVRRSHFEPTEIRSTALLTVPLFAAMAFLVLPLVALFVRAWAAGGFQAFVDVATDAQFLDALQRTLMLSAVVTAACLVTGTIYAVAAVGAPPLIGRILLVLIVGAFWISLLVRTFGWVVLFQPNGALDQLVQSLGMSDKSLDLLQTTTAMYPAMVHVLLPFFVLPVYAGMSGLDPALLRASESLGAGPLTVLRHVIIPHLRASLGAGSALVFMLALSFYVTPLLLGGPSQLTIATLIDRKFNREFDLGSASVMGIVLLVTVMVLFLIVDRFVSIVPTGTERRS